MEPGTIDPTVRGAFAELVGAIFDHHSKYPIRPADLLWRQTADPGLLAIHDSAPALGSGSQPPLPNWESRTGSLWKSYPFDQFAPAKGLEPGVRTAAGGTRLGAGGIFSALVQPAFARLHVTGTLVTRQAVIDESLRNLDDLDRALQGKSVRALVVCGIAGLTLDQQRIETPWGTLRPLPAVDPMWQFHHPEAATCCLADARSISIKIDRAAEWSDHFDSEEISHERAKLLLPVAAALASKEVDRPRGPVFVWSTVIPSISPGFGSSWPLLQGTVSGGKLNFEATELEGWCGKVGNGHRSTIDVAARRLSNALSYRWERSDVLIDAITIWENLLGTSSEVAFRVTAAIAKLVEPDTSRRLPLRRRLNEIYDLRSRIVHGAAADPAKVDAAAKEALAVSIRVLRVFYDRGPEWLDRSSQDRSTAILMIEP